MTPDDQIRDVLPKLEDGQSLAPGTYKVTVRKADEPYSCGQEWEVTVPDKENP
jgi:hypothetical protein